MFLVLSEFTSSPISEHWFRKFKSKVASDPRHGVQLNDTHSRNKEMAKKREKAKKGIEKCMEEKRNTAVGMLPWYSSVWSNIM